LKRNSNFASQAFAALGLLLLANLQAVCAQEAAQKPAEKHTETAAASSEPQLPAQIELLETHIRFEINGDSRKEVHTRVHINNELGVRQFARLNFDFNRSFESIEIPQVRITHSSGGTADILPSAITDNPNPAVVNYPAYQDVRVKSVRILGLEPGDTLEYRVITTVSHHPLAPDFWLEHSFDRTGVVAREIFELDLPAVRKPEVQINPATPAAAKSTSGEGDAARTDYRWERTRPDSPGATQHPAEDLQDSKPDIALSTEDWERLSIRMDEVLTPGAKSLFNITNSEESIRELSRRQQVTPEIAGKAAELTKGSLTNRARLEAVYDFVSQKIATVDLPLGSTGFAARTPNDVLSAGYASPEDKFVLFAALAASLKLGAEAALTGYCDAKEPARPTVFKHLLISAYDGTSSYLLDPSLEVAPFGVIPPSSGECAFVLNREFFAMNSTGHEWKKLEAHPPFPSIQRVSIEAALGSDGTLKSKVHYSIRGQNELLLRVAFHQTPKENWKEVARLLALSDGFRGKIISVEASDPFATKEPFTVQYEIEQPKFVDWSKKPVRIPAILPLVGLPDPPAKPTPGASSSPIELGTPLDVETQVTLHLPPGTSALTPTGISVTRDYATFTSKYSATGPTLTASRHLNFLLRELPADRVADYNTFLRAVQNDQAQDFTLDRPAPPPPGHQPLSASKP